MQPITIIQFAVRVRAYVHSKNWSVKNNSSSVIFNTSEECEEGQHSECYTNTPWGVAISTRRKCYLDLTIGSVALTLLEGCFDTLDTLSTRRNRHFHGLVLTHCSASLKTLWVQSNTFHGFSEHSVVKPQSVTHCKRYFNTHCMFYNYWLLIN